MSYNYKTDKFEHKCRSCNKLLRESDFPQILAEVNELLFCNHHWMNDYFRYLNSLDLWEISSLSISDSVDSEHDLYKYGRDNTRGIDSSYSLNGKYLNMFYSKILKKELSNIRED